MWVLSFDDGIVAASWYAELAFRNRVSMSAIGSVIVMGCRASLAAVPRALVLGDLAPGLSAIGGARLVTCWNGSAAATRGARSVSWGAAGPFCYQELLLTPGSSPACAIS